MSNTTEGHGGHPAHQVRQFTVTIRHGTGRPQAMHVWAATRDDAVFRAGLALGFAEPNQWIVTGVHDPAEGDPR